MQTLAALVPRYQKARLPQRVCMCRSRLGMARVHINSLGLLEMSCWLRLAADGEDSGVRWEGTVTSPALAGALHPALVHHFAPSKTGGSCR